MSDEEMIGTLGARFRTAKEAYNKGRTELGIIAERAQRLATALQGEDEAEISLALAAGTIPTGGEIQQLLIQINVARVQMENAKAQLANLNLNVE